MAVMPSAGERTQGASDLCVIQRLLGFAFFVPDELLDWNTRSDR